jgi:geranylgeranyl reductase family protein
MSYECDALIVGGGPSGLIVGSVISEKGFETIVLEEHGRVGRPEQCAGLVSSRIGNIPQRLILNRVETARFYIGGKHFEVSSEKKMLVIDRNGYDNYLAEKAFEKGVEIRVGERVVGLKGGMVFTSRGNVYSGRILIGADGPNSIIAKLKGLKQPKNVLFAIQCIAKGAFERDIVEIRFDSQFSNSGFAWVVPLSNNEARIGLATRDNPIPRINLLLKKLNAEAIGKPIGDSIRFGIMNKTVASRTVLVGDAACQVKPFSFGGLVYGKICSEIAGRACVKALEEGFLEEYFLVKAYESAWRKVIGGALKKGLMMRALFEIMRRASSSFTLIRVTGLNLIAGRILDPDFLSRFIGSTY